MVTSARLSVRHFSPDWHICWRDVHGPQVFHLNNLQGSSDFSCSATVRLTSVVLSDMSSTWTATSSRHSCPLQDVTVTPWRSLNFWQILWFMAAYWAQTVTPPLFIHCWFKEEFFRYLVCSLCCKHSVSGEWIGGLGGFVCPPVSEPCLVDYRNHLTL